jgi:carboxymethylenebutenolidase
MAEEIKRLLEELRDGKLSRRDFMSRVIMMTGSLAAANAMIDSLTGADASAAQVQESDPAILAHNVTYDGKAGKVSAYLVRPTKAGKYPGVIAIHENEGLSDHIRDVARRLAREGYVVLAPDYLSRLGGTRLVTPKGTGISNIRELVPWQVIAEDTASGFNYLRILPDVRADKQGLIGFCWGGEMTFAAATQIPTLDAAVVYYSISSRIFARR